MTIGIYCIRNTVDNKRYIGKSSNIEKRWSVHRSRPDNRHLANSIKKFGILAFEFSILESFPVLENETLANREIYWMDHFNTFDRRFGYNLVRDSSSNIVMHEETKLLISASLTGFKRSRETRERMSAAQKGHPVSLEQIAKMTGRKRSPEARAKMSVSASMRPPMTDETRAKIAFNSKNISQETRGKLSAARKGRPLSPEHRAAVARANRNCSPERLRKMSDGCKLRSQRPEYRAKLSAAMLRRNAGNRARKALLIWLLAA